MYRLFAEESELKGRIIWDMNQIHPKFYRIFKKFATLKTITLSLEALQC
jgi:hypothetical protein